MAKPGSNGARQISGAARAVDLDRVRLTDQQAWELQETLELQEGRRCSGCGRRIGVGFTFTSLAVRDQVPVMRMAACSREDCDFAEQARDGATFMEVVEYAWLDEAGMDAPPAAAIVQRNEKRAQRAAAEAEAKADG